MIQIDMDKPKDCIWADITNHIYYCPLLNEYHKCNLQDYEPRTIEEQYVHCPLHEADPDTVSRQAVRDAVYEELDSIDHVPQWVFDRLTKKIENLPPSPTLGRQAEPQTTEWLMGGVSYINEESVYCSKCRWAWSKKEDLGFFEYCPNCGRKILYRGKWRKVSKNESQGGAV